MICEVLPHDRNAMEMPSGRYVIARDTVESCERNGGGDIELRVVLRHLIGTVLSPEFLDDLTDPGGLRDGRRLSIPPHAVHGEGDGRRFQHVPVPLAVSARHRKQVQDPALLDEPHGPGDRPTGRATGDGQLDLVRVFQGLQELLECHGWVLGASDFARRWLVMQTVSTGSRVPGPEMALADPSDPAAF